MNRITSGPFSTCGFSDKHCVHAHWSQLRGNCWLLLKAVDYINLGTGVKQILITAETAFGEGLNRFTTPVSNCLIAITLPTFQTFCLLIISLISLSDSLIGWFEYAFTVP